MIFKNVVFIIEDEGDLKFLSFIKNLATKLGVSLYYLTINPNLTIDGNAKYISNNLEETISYALNSIKADLVIAHRKKIDPFKMIFLKPEYVKLAEKFSNARFLFLREDVSQINKIGVAIDFEDEENYIDYLKASYEFSKALDIEPEFLFSFNQVYYETALTKTHTEEEARQIIQEMLETKINKIKENLAKALNGKEAILKVLKGEPKREIPFYIHENNFDICIISSKIKNKVSYLENIEVSIGIF
ncbi:MAG TPA: hypothetical protein EYH43_04380 [Persephonella sp.]|nr:hypothetical protein [Hydrogenothermaceae bacterium]HIQ25201.1 hypothetical protein [Persephonella sp.]